MNLRGPRRADDVEIFITPFVDVLLVLLLFFVVSTTFVRSSSIELTLPQAARSESEQDANRIFIDIDREGITFIDGQQLSGTTVAAIENALAAAAQGKDEPTIVISADEQATHQSVITVMDAARQAGLVRITFVTRDRNASEAAD
ncbi:MAG: biopolymer transporter ExbD [Anaerolineae bacterium]|nr:biopolymer transporter ExbD [Anaerolineae bacterium]